MNTKQKTQIQIILKSILSIPILWLMIFWPTNFNLDYWQGWLFFVVMMIYIAIVLYFFKDETELAKERMSFGKSFKGVPLFEKIFYVIFVPSCFAVLIVAAFDAGQFYWSPELSVFTYILAYISFILGSILITWPMMENKWFSSVVRIQKERKQKVVTTGPYAIVRHPGYVASILMMPPISLMLGSIYGLIPGVILILALIWRTYNEDKFLQKNLPGYKAYTKKTKYRLIPGVW